MMFVLERYGFGSNEYLAAAFPMMWSNSHCGECLYSKAPAVNDAFFHNYRCAYSTVPCQSKSTVSKKEYSQKNFSGYFLPYLGIQNCDQNLKEQESS